MAQKTEKTGKQQSMQERYPRTISEKLFKSWQTLKRLGDAGLISVSIPASRPIVDRALKYGHVKDEKITTGINDFFNKRVKDEQKQYEKLLTNATNTKKTP